MLSYFSDQCKYFYIPLYSDSRFTKRQNFILGSQLDVPMDSSRLLDKIIRAKRGNYSHIKVPLDRPDCPLIQKLISLSDEMSFDLVFQVSAKLVSGEELRRYLPRLPKTATLEWVIDDVEEVPNSKLFEVASHFCDTYFSVLAHGALDWFQTISAIDQLKVPQVYLHFSYELSKAEFLVLPPEKQLVYQELSLLCATDAYELLVGLRKRFPQIDFLPPKGLDLWDHRIAQDFELEPFYSACAQWQSAQPNVRVSVVIPSFENQQYLVKVLDNLYRQTLPKDLYEVVVVDDGGNDRTVNVIKESYKQHYQGLNLRCVYFPRNKHRTMGDGQYRAGIARNLGVKNSCGEILCFLDSDIIVPTDYLEKVEEALKVADGVQARRINLKQSASEGRVLYENIHSGHTTRDEAYWENFNRTDDWQSLNQSWKYLCTHSFSIRKELFLQLGAFKKNYIFYGFEDTDFGYRLVKTGGKLKLLDIRVYHLYHRDERSEFRNLRYYRHFLLTKTAQIFFFHHLDPEIYQNLRGFMGRRSLLKRLFRRTKFFRSTP